MNSRAEPLVHTNDDYAGPTKPLTLAIDIGGSHLKAAVLNASGKISTGPLRVETPKPATPDAVVAALVSLSQQLGQFDRVSIGFPGVVRADFVLTAPNLGTKEWHGFRLGAVLAEALGKPVRMLNDASIQGLGVITGRGLECVLTMGTGMFPGDLACGARPHRFASFGNDSIWRVMDRTIACPLQRGGS
jgi:polyphosphate glucokinase